MCMYVQNFNSWYPGVFYFQAAASVGTIYTQSTMSNYSMADVTAAAPQSLRFFQLYIHKSRDTTVELVRRAERLGYKALVLTVDAPTSFPKWKDIRNKLQLPKHLG